MFDSLSSLPRVRVLMTMPCAQVGVGMTCRSLLAAASGHGVRTHLFTSQFDGPVPDALDVHAQLRASLGWLPFVLTRPMVRRGLHRAYLGSLHEGDIAYLWPSCPASVYEAVAARGATIVGEAVNTRMAAAKPVLDAAYEGLGLRPGHQITDARIAEQNRRHALCDAIFAPSPATEQALQGTELETRVIPTSYGTWVPKALLTRSAWENDAPVRFLFVGSAGVRKGLHLLLDAWRNAPPDANLRIVGQIEPAIRRLFSDVLDSANVSCAGFVHDVAAEYACADVALLPSLEEGDPIVTYEAAAHGVPMIASQVGAGRIGADTGVITVIDPTDVHAFRATIAEFAASEELRRSKGAAARKAAFGYDWSIVARTRFERLASFLGG